MNWKNVLFLLRVERKSGRLIRGIKATRYRENKFIAYWPYWVAAIIGIVVGLVASFVVSLVYSAPEASNYPPIGPTAMGVFVVFPTLVLLLSFVFTLLQQIQLTGIKATGQVMYWLPITWQEQTLASILSNLLGWPTAIVIGMGAGTIVFSAFNGLILQGLLTTVVFIGSAFMASSLTEILRLIQMRFVGAVYKSSGRAAIWVRLIGTLLFFTLFYIIYLYVVTGTGTITFINTLSNIQSGAWYVPFVWPALISGYLFRGLFLSGILFVVLSSLFIVGLYYVAVFLNQRYGLYEPPAITLQKSGVYTPKAGLLGKLGLSTAEAAIVRKDIRAFTRRREMIGVFMVPVILIIVPIMQSLGLSGTSNSSASPINPIFMVMIFLLPAAFMAMLIGEILIGEEGQSVWRIYASPISPKNLVKSKYFSVIVFPTSVLLISGTVGTFFYHTGIEMTALAFIETFFVVLAVGAVALTVGFKGPDFSQTRRARMIRQEWSLIGLVVCTITGAAVLAPIILATGISVLTGGTFISSMISIDVVISGIISIAISLIFYRINVGIATDFLRKAQI